MLSIDAFSDYDGSPPIKKSGGYSSYSDYNSLSAITSHHSFPSSKTNALMVIDGQWIVVDSKQSD